MAEDDVVAVRMRALMEAVLAARVFVLAEEAQANWGEDYEFSWVEFRALKGALGVLGSVWPEALGLGEES